MKLTSNASLQLLEISSAPGQNTWSNISISITIRANRGHLAESSFYTRIEANSPLREISLIYRHCYMIIPCKTSINPISVHAVEAAINSPHIAAGLLRNQIPFRQQRARSP